MKKKKSVSLEEIDIEALAKDLAAAKLEAKGIKTGRFGKPIRVPIPAKPTEVKKVRRSLGVTQQDFASIVGVSLDAVKSWETGRRPPEGPASKIIRLIRRDARFGKLLAGI